MADTEDGRVPLFAVTCKSFDLSCGMIQDEIARTVSTGIRKVIAVV
jgi:hypothetical protein